MFFQQHWGALLPTELSLAWQIFPEKGGNSSCLVCCHGTRNPFGHIVFIFVCLGKCRSALWQPSPGSWQPSKGVQGCVEDLGAPGEPPGIPLALHGTQQTWSMPVQGWLPKDLCMPEVPWLGLISPAGSCMLLLSPVCLPSGCAGFGLRVSSAARGCSQSSVLLSALIVGL